MKKFLSINKLSEIDIRFLFLLGLLVFLPGFEVLKNLFAILFVLSWVVVAKKNNYWGGKWRIVDSIFLLWIKSLLYFSNGLLSYILLMPHRTLFFVL